MKSKHLLLTLLLALFVPWAANAQTLTVHDASGTNMYVPFYGYYADEDQTNQMIYPATELADMNGKAITEMVFYWQEDDYYYGNFYGVGTWTVSLGETTATTLSGLDNTTSLTPVFTGVLDEAGGLFDNTAYTLTIAFDDQYVYGGGNLLVQFSHTGTDEYEYYVFEGESVTGASYCYGSQRNFLPKTTFTYTPGGSSTAIAPGVTTSETVANLTNVSATLGGTITDMGGANSVQAGICYSTTSNPTTADGHVHSKVTSTGAYTQNITGLQPNTIYYFRAYAYNSANSLAEPSYGDVYSFTTAGNITLNQPANGTISASVNGGTATTSSTYALEGQSVTLTATAADGYSLDCWNVTGVTGEASGNTYTFTMPSNNVTATASIIPTPGGSSTSTAWAETTSISTEETYLIGAVSGNDVYLVLNYSPNTSNHYYYNNNSNYWSYTAKATLSNGIITGCTGNATDLQYAQWKFSAETGGTITSNYESGRYLYGTTGSWTDLYPNTSSTNWTYADNKLSYSSSNYYLYLNSSYYVQKGTSTTASTVKLYTETSVTTYAITATANPSEGGTIAGSDYYANGTTCTLTATPAFGYDFVSWTEGGEVVSIDAAYTFTVSGARTLIANFESQGSCIKPTDLAQVPETQAAHQAQLSWTENNEATEWELVYSTESDFNPDNETPIAVNSNPATIPGLAQATTYYARVRTICGQSSQSGWSEKATFVTISGHQAPTSVSHDPATLEAHKVTITWTGVATNVLHESYDLYYSTIDETPTTQTPQYTGITATSKEIDGLDAAKTYYVWVRDYCGDDGYSDWTGAAPFTTECEAYTITSTYKYRQEFESPVVNSVYNSTTGLELPVCWENPYTTGSNNAGKPHLVKAGASYNYASSGQVLLFYGSGSNYVTLPEFTNDLQDLQISFKWATETSSSSAILTLGYITEEDVNYNTFTAISDATTFTASATSQYSLIPAGPIELSALPATAKRLAFRWSYNSQYSCNIDDVVVELIPSCKVPTGLTCTGYTATTATFEWTTNGTNQTAWQLYISETNEAPSDDIDQNLVINANTNPFTVSSGLQAEHTYYAWVRGNCTASSEGYSEWSEGIEFMPSAYKDFTYQDGATSYTGYLPIYGSSTNNATNKGQMLIPASYFPTQMNDATVRRLTFYTTSNYATADWGDAEFNVLVAEIDATSFETAAFFDWGDMTTVYSGKLSVSDQQMVINLDAPFTYNGGNLLIGFNLTKTGTTKYVTWVASFESNCHLGVYQYSTNSASYANYKVKTTFNYLPNATPRPINPHATEELSTEATVAWTAPNSTEVVGYQYQYKLATVTEWPTALTSTTALTAPISGLTPEETYDFRVRAVYPGPAYSQYAETQFTTTAACAIPDGLAASNITMVSADLTWNTSVEVANYTVEYRTVAGNDGSMLRVDFNSLTTASTIPEGWDNSEGTTTNASYKWCYNTKTSGNGQAVGPENTPCVVFDSYNNDKYNTNFLKTPAMNFPAGKTMQLSFWWKNPAGGDFSVYISTDGGTTKTAIAEGLTGQSTWTQKEIDLTGYEGASNVTIHFKGTSNYGYGDAYIYLDNVLVGEVVPAGAWTEATNVAPNTGAYTITLPNAGVKYDVRVYSNCTTDPDNESTITTITTLADGTKVFTNAGNDGLWNTEANWVPAGAPAITESAILRANATIASGTVATAKKITFEGATTPTLTINDGGQLQTDNTVTATVKKNITGYGAGNEEDRAGYYLIGNPLSSTIYSSGIPATGMTTGSYDLYQWNYTAYDGLEWRNYEASTFSLYNAQGYLYANAANTELTFTGSVLANNTEVEKTSSYTDDYVWKGWSLWANPFVCNAYITSANVNLSFYRMNADGSGFEAATGAIAPMEGIFVQATGTNQKFKFTRTAPDSNSGQGNLNINLTEVVTTRDKQPATDNAIICFGGSSTLEKFSFRQGSTKVFITEEGKDYAVVNAESNVGEIPVSFKAEKNGSYSLSFTSQEVTFSYLHLIDNMTGVETDLLANPSYTFEARTTDYASRFKLVFATGSSTGSDTFAYYSNGNWVINNEGRATLQVVDVNGRILKSESINGCANVNFKAAAGIYMIRLVNGDNVKVQKVVVR